MRKILFLIIICVYAGGLNAQEEAFMQEINQALAAAQEKDWKTAVEHTRMALRQTSLPEVKEQYTCILAQFLTLQSSDEWTANDSVSAFAHSEEAAQLCPGDELVQLHWQMQHYSKSIQIKETAGEQAQETYLTKAIDKARQLGVADNHLRGALSLIYISYGQSERETKGFEAAINQFERAIAVSDKGTKERALAESSLGGTYSSWAQDMDIRTNQYERILELSQLAQEHYLAGGHRDRAIKEYTRQAQTLTKSGRYNDAVSLMEGALQLCAGDTTLLRPRAELLSALGDMQVEHEEYQQGLAHLEEAYQLYEQEGDGLRCASVAMKLNNIYTYQIQDSDKAEFWMTRRAEGLRDNDDIAIPVSWLELMPDYKKGMEAIYKERKPDDGLRIALSLIARADALPEFPLEKKADFHTLAGVALLKKGTPKEAALQFQRSIALLEESGTAGEGDLPTVWEYLGGSYYQQGMKEEAVRCASMAVATAEHHYGPTHTTTLDAYSQRANLNGFAGHGEAAARDIAHCFEMIRENVMRNFVFLTKEERAAYWNANRPTIAVMPAFAHRLGLHDGPFVTTLYNQQLLSKGLLLSAESALQRTIDASPSLRATYDEIHALKAKALNPQTSAAYAVAATLDASRKEREMGQAASSMDQYLNFLEVKASDVRDHLKEGEAAVELLDYRVGKDSVMYAALVLCPGWKEARMVPLFEQRALEGCMNPDFYTDSAKTRMVWQPLMDILGHEVQTIYFAPSGLLHQVAIEWMCDETGKPMSERYQLHRLSSTRWLALPREQGDSHTAVLFGGIDYSGYSGSGVTTYTRGAKTGVPALPYTAKEVADIATALRSTFQVQLREAAEGSEANMKALSAHAPSVLHIATHGFFIDNPAKIPTTLKGSLGLTGQETDEEQSLKMSGLIFAKSGTDGIATAAELADYDLSSTDLVVLSACETGLGVLNTDGVFGLQRGFKKAGVGSIVMSLWKVDDEATQRMMTLFYGHWLRHGDKRKAFLEAQRTIRSEYPDPRYWAAFILLD